MKKKILAAIVAVLLICVPMTACESYTNPTVEGKQNTDYVVTSNGGSAVKYGNYIYYINGYGGYTDEDGSQNNWGSVTKGGLYRAELKGSETKFDYMTPFGVEVEGLKTFASSYDIDTGYNFVTEKKSIVTGYRKDDDGNILYDDNDNPYEIVEEVNEPVSYRIASKKIGTSGYKKGGIFIYDDYVYYSTPSNKQNKDGTFATDLTVFYRTKLDGTGTTKLYRTKNSSSSSPYAFYKQGDKVYLVVQDGTSVISVTIGKKVESVKEIATDVTGVLFPTKDVYYKGISTNTVEDFVYCTRAITDTDKVRAGNILMVMRPNGTEKFEIASNNTVTLRGTSNGYLFYSSVNSLTGVEQILYTNLHEQFMGENENGEVNSPSYQAAYEDLSKNELANGGNTNLVGHQSGVAFSQDGMSSYSDIVCVRPNKRSNQIYTFYITSGSLAMYDGSETTTLSTGSVTTIYAIVGTDVFFADGSGNYYLADTDPSGNKVITLAEGFNSEATFGLDVVDDLVMMFGDVDDYASGYSLFYNLNRPDNEKQFVGVRESEDIYDPTVELQPATDETTDEAN